MEDGEDQNQQGKAFAESYAPDLHIAAQACVVDRPIDPCTLIILGASGDLTARKLVPSLYNLFLSNGLPTRFAIVGCSRKEWTRKDFQNRMKRAIKEAGVSDASKWSDFATALYYEPVTYDSLASYERLRSTLRDIEGKHETEGNLVFYLALPPSLYKSVAGMLGAAGLASEGEEGNGWARIVIEKPFGRDLETAADLDRSLHESFQENQIYRIDHYLAKETVQNVLVFRFANSIFEPLWNRSYIDHVRITAAETLGVEHRAGYYEDAGVLRDMFQNHMMQLLALTAMDPPSLFQAERVRDEKLEVFQALRPMPLDKIDEHLLLGQYGAGKIGSTVVPAYRDEAGVNAESVTPTFALMRVYLDNWRWQGVPFCLISGKRLARKLTEIVIQFKRVPHSMFRPVLGEHITVNRLTLGIQPEEKITLTFQTKNPGATFCLRSVTMDFDYHQNYEGPRLDAYEKCLLDCMQGDHMLFWRQDAVELCWAFLTPILDNYEQSTDSGRRLRFYQAGSWGPLSPGQMEKFLREGIERS
ncbi:MAG: glucose-6-phosphate dehydrogenase [Proteobacteria bacterium]|nr:glucose-6-phosphate dehydrogenase [Pseudomonadota bacterium]